MALASLDCLVPMDGLLTHLLLYLLVGYRPPLVVYTLPNCQARRIRAR